MAKAAGESGVTYPKIILDYLDNFIITPARAQVLLDSLDRFDGEGRDQLIRNLKLPKRFDGGADNLAALVRRVAADENGELRFALLRRYWPTEVDPLVLQIAYASTITMAGALWVLAFLLYSGVYAPILVGPRADGRPG